MPRSYRVIQSPLPEHSEQPFAAPPRPPKPSAPVPRRGREDAATQEAFARLKKLELKYPHRAPKLYRLFRQTLGIVESVDATAKKLESI